MTKKHRSPCEIFADAISRFIQKRLTIDLID